MKSLRAASLLALASLATALAVPSAAKATIFTVGGQQYDVTTFTGTYNDNPSLFNTPSAGGVMPWFGNDTLATAFANAVGADLGLINNGVAGPMFAYSIEESFDFIVLGSAYAFGTANLQSEYGYNSISYARATLIPPSVTSTPGPLPILGAASALGMSRRLRRRIATRAFKL